MPSNESQLLPPHLSCSTVSGGKGRDAPQSAQPGRSDARLSWPCSPAGLPTAAPAVRLPRSCAGSTPQLQLLKNLVWFWFPHLPPLQKHLDLLFLSKMLCFLLHCSGHSVASNLETYVLHIWENFLCYSYIL